MCIVVDSAFRKVGERFRHLNELKKAMGKIICMQQS